MTKVIDFGTLKTLSKCRNIEYYFELDDAGDVRMFTAELIYGSHLEIIFSKQKQCFVIKNYEKLKKQYWQKHNGSNPVDNCFCELLELEV